jgi:hypothetical protein
MREPAATSRAHDNEVSVGGRVDQCLRGEAVNRVDGDLRVLVPANLLRYLSHSLLSRLTSLLNSLSVR